MSHTIKEALYNRRTELDKEGSWKLILAIALFITILSVSVAYPDMPDYCFQCLHDWFH